MAAFEVVTITNATMNPHSPFLVYKHLHGKFLEFFYFVFTYYSVNVLFMLPHKIPLTNLHIFNIENVLYFMYNKNKPIKTRKPKKKNMSVKQKNTFN